MRRSIFQDVLCTLALLPLAIAQFGPYFIFYNPPTSGTFQRLDPILFPHERGIHLHHVHGPCQIGLDADLKGLTYGNCTSNRLKTDRSPYWYPTLYVKSKSGGYRLVPENPFKLYYLYGDDRLAPARKVVEFPPGHQMIAGDTWNRQKYGGNNKLYDPKHHWSCGATNGFDEFPRHLRSCEDGLRVEITFPSCWNGKAFNHSDMRAHMAYIAYRHLKELEVCPETHRVARFPEIKAEVWWNVSAIVDDIDDADGDPWVFSNGDPTGFGFHMDFVNGWQIGQLQHMIENCGCGNTCNDQDLKGCAGPENLVTDQEYYADEPQMESVFPGEDASHVSLLPGCNPIQSGPERATMATDGPGCATAFVNDARLPRPNEYEYNMRANAWGNETMSGHLTSTAVSNKSTPPTYKPSTPTTTAASTTKTSHTTASSGSSTLSRYTTSRSSTSPKRSTATPSTTSARRTASSTPSSKEFASFYSQYVPLESSGKNPQA